ncbi:hypothetical protein [uncultured Sphingomonas sp.]|uniref:hypothetical protein n=1 Tax=uncultured Sphingomonas sp. TaxID=158754 RepID=UPI0035CC5614
MPDTSPPDPPRRLSLEQRLAIYNASVVSVGALLAAIAWFPNFKSKQQELSAFALLKDNPAGVLTVRDLGPVAAGPDHHYDVSYTLMLKNAANRDFEIWWSLDQIFIGTAADEHTPKAVVEPINDPPDIWDPSPPGTVLWRELKYDLSYQDGLNDPEVKGFFRERRKAETSPAGGLTGLYVPGHTSAHSAHYLVTSRPDALINVTITYGMNRPRTLWDRITGNKTSSLYEGANLTGESVRLADATEPGCRLGIAVQNAQIKSACQADPF